MPETIMLLHGFGGTGRTWDAVAARIDPARYTPVAPDLRGHGRRSRHRPATFDGCVRDVLALAPDRPFVLAGYSMGGRLALHVALAAPARVRRLMLVSATAGIADPDERAARAEADLALAERLEAMTPDAWADLWTVQPIFAGTPAEVLPAWREDLSRTPPADAAAALRGLGTGAMAPLWDRLGELGMPVQVVAGERDTRYVELGEALVGALPHAELVVLPGAGHGLPREAPEALAALLQQAGT
jgi:2-succinyl-6-hydroxy-2,4-cyclohexadiene-1-carboxylate synthase